MGYIRCNGWVYGVKPCRLFWESILLHLPIINLLYTKKISLHLTSRQKGGAPICGIFSSFRIFRNQACIAFKFRVPECPYTNVYVTVQDRDGNILAHRNLPSTNIYYVGLEYSDIIEMIHD